MVIASETTPIEVPLESWEFGKRRVRPLTRLILHPTMTLADVAATAYLQGVWDGWQVCEKQYDDAIETMIEERG